MSRKLIIEGNAVYEIDENCMLTKQVEQTESTKDTQTSRYSDSDPDKRRGTE